MEEQRVFYKKKKNVRINELLAELERHAKLATNTSR